MTENNIKAQLTAFDAFAEDFDIAQDPLEIFDQRFKEADADPIDIYCKAVVMQRNNIYQTNRSVVLYIQNWGNYMNQFDRHPACPRVIDVSQYIHMEIDKGNTAKTIFAKLKHLCDMFDYWSNDPNMPHGTGEAKGYNPIETALQIEKEKIKANRKTQNKQPYPFVVEEISHKIRQTKNILHRAFIVDQIKHGSRGGQTCYTQLQDVNLNHDDLNELYPDLGSHHRLNNIDEDAIYYPPISEREGVKSKRPTVIPVDNELKRLLIKYLQQRPPMDEPWLFLNPSSCKKISTQYANDKFWRGTFRPEYCETKIYRAVTSHTGRHWFNTYWKKEVDIDIEYLKYLRGDKQGDLNSNSGDAMYEYIHTYYEDVKDLYLDNIFKFDI